MVEGRVQEWLNTTGASLSSDSDEEDHQGLFHRKFFNGTDSDSSDGSEPPELFEAIPAGTGQGVVHHQEQGQRSKYSRPPRQPPWFDNRPFQYNGRILLTSLPGLTIILSLTGEMLLSIMAITTLVVYLLVGAGEHKKALVGFFIGFICCQFTIIYSALPLLWLSVFNLVLIMVLNMYTVLTGCWIVIQFEHFRLEQPDFAKFIESFLFSLYPAVCIVLLTWMISSLTTPLLAPYSLIVLGFVLFQIFLSPTPSSFHKATPEYRDRGDHFILEPALVGMVGLLYCITPPTLFVMVTALKDFWSLFTFGTVLQWMFTVSLSVFLTTFLSIRPFLEFSDIPRSFVQRSRWGSGLMALLLVSQVIYNCGGSSTLLPWLPVAAVLYTSYGYFVHQKQKQWTQVAVGLLLVLLMIYACLFYTLPWRLKYLVADESVHIRSVYILLYINVILCVVIVFVCSQSPAPEPAGVLLALQSQVFVLSQKLLLGVKLYPLTSVLLVLVFSLYVILKLYHAGKIPWQHSCVTIATYFTSVQDVCDSLVPDQPGGATWWTLYCCAAAFLLGLVGSRILMFEERKFIPESHVVYYLVACIVSVLGCIPSLFTKLSWLALHTQLAFSDGLGLALFISGLLYVKVGYMHQCDRIPAKYISPVVMGTGALVILLQPSLDLSWNAVQAWALVTGLGSSLAVVPMATHIKSTNTLAVAGTLMGFPLGVGIADWVFPSSPLFLLSIICGALGTVFVILTLFSWQKVKDLDNKVTVLFSLLVLCCMGLVITDVTNSQPGITRLHSVSLIATVCTLAASVLKLLSFRDQVPDLTKSDYVTVSQVSTLGNVCTLLAFLFLVLIHPFHIWEFWCCLCSTVFFLLQRDNYVLLGLNKDNYCAPPIFVITAIFVLSACVNSAFWTFTISFAFFRGFLEVVIIATQLPVYYVLATVLWYDEVWISDRNVVFLTPINSLLFMFATSYSAWVLGAYGIGIGTWLILCKLPLVVERY